MKNSENKKIISRIELIKTVAKLKKKNKKIVITNGCFDILHPGHISYLKKSKELGDVLIVLINTDKSVKKNKGPKRPINNLAYREIVLSQLESVNYITSFSEKTPEKLYKILSPSILTKGRDALKKKVAGALDVKKNGGVIKFINYDSKYSTTKIIKKISSRY